MDDLLTVQGLTMMGAWYLIFLLSTTLHEAAHALVAWKLGDDTAYRGGQVSLDPAPHVQREPIGTVVVPLVTYILNHGQWLMGWASCPYDPIWAARHPHRAAKMALAGPAANLTLVIAAGLLMRLGIAVHFFEPPKAIDMTHVVDPAAPGWANAFATILSIVFMLNLVLCIFNLLPLPPLDGSGVVQLLMDERSALSFQTTMRNPTFGLIGLVVAWNAFPFVFKPAFRMAIAILYPDVHYGPD